MIRASKKMFFMFSPEDLKKDIDHIIQQYFTDCNLPDTSKIKISRTTRWTNQSRILQLFNYQLATEEAQIKLQEKAARIVTVYSKSLFVFKELIHFLENHRIVIPGYSTMQDLVGNALSDEKKRIEVLTKKHIPQDMLNSLKNFLSTDHGVHEVTKVKKEPKSFKWKEIRREVDNRNSLKPFYEVAKDFLPKLGISNENIKYYASMVNYYTVYKLKRMMQLIVYTYLLCFIFNRYQKISNNLLNGLIYQASNFKKEAKTAAKETVYNKKIEFNRDLKQAGKVFDLFMDDDIPNETEFGKVRDTAFGYIEKDKFPSVINYIIKASFDEKEYEWDHIKNLSLAFKKNLRPIFLNIDIESQAKNDHLMRAVEFLQTALNSNKSLNQFKLNNIPKKFIPKKLKKYMYKTEQKVVNGKTRNVKQLDVDKYEFLIYLLLKGSLESGDIFCRHSTQFRSLEDELIDKEYWEKNKDKILDDIDYPRLKKPIEETLLRLEEKLEKNIAYVNKRIEDGQNNHIKVTGKGDNIKWSLPYKKLEDTENHSFYSHIPQIGIENVLSFVNKQCGFFEAFTHILGKYIKNDADNNNITAVVVALATNTGISTMGEISDISYQALYTTSKNFIRLETLRNANDMISNAIAQNPFFRYYDIDEGVIHSSSDGQKLETQIKTVNARHSPKYFGLKEGVTSYTLVANHVPVNAKIIGANEHESHYVFDILYNNTSEIKSERHSTDSHGKNNANFMTLYFFNYMFAPRYKNLRRNADKICGFKAPSQYKNCLIKPVRKVKRQLIIDEKDNVLRVLASLALKTSTQSAIMRKLSSYTKQNKTKKAMWELNDIINSDYILTYIDDLILRQGVQRALNRGESYHKLRKAVSHAYSGKFRVKTELEQNIWNECARLVSNSIVFYNIEILSNLHDQLISQEKQYGTEILKKISPVAWRHINLRGNFQFRDSQSVDLDKIIIKLVKMTISKYATGNEESFI